MARTRKTVLGDNPFASDQEETSVRVSEKETTGDRAQKGSVKPTAATAKSKPARKPNKARFAKKPADGKASEGSGKAKLPQIPTKKATKRSGSTTLANGTDGKKPAPKATKVAKPTPVTGSSNTRNQNEPVPAAVRRHLADRIRQIENPGDDVPASSRPSSPRSAANLPNREGVLDAARELLSSDYYVRQWGRIGIRNRSEEVDDFGYDRSYDARFNSLLDLVYKHYFRVDVEGVQHVPSQGRVLIVANHGGTFPYDGIMLKTALRREHPACLDVRWLAEDHLFYMPFLGSFLNRLGAVRACQENAERLLRQERLVAVFPEGAKGTGRLYRNRYKLQRFGRGGFVRLCLRTKTPIVPCVILGAEESMPLLFRIESLANLLGVPYIPITPTFPALGPLGVVPAPTKWQIIFGEPIRFDRHGIQSADDHVLVRRLTERVRATMQGMLDHAAAKRRSIWFG